MASMHWLARQDGAVSWLTKTLGWTLLHFCWQGVAVAVVVWCGLRLLEGSSARMRYAAACFGLACMVALPIATFARLAAQTRPSDVRLPVRMDLDLSVTADGDTGAEPMQERIQRLLDEAAPWVPLVWVVGMGLFAARLNLGLATAGRMRRAQSVESPREMQRAFVELAQRLGVRRAVRLVHSAVVQVPTVIGWLQPMVLIPIGCLSGLSQMQVEALLAHELAHIRRNDYLVSVAQGVVEALLFYHPAVWWVSRQVRRERECCCDEIAVAVSGSALEYAKALSFLEAKRRKYPEVALGANGGVLTMRIRRLLGVPESSAGSQIAALAVLGVVTVGAVLSVSTVARAQLGSAVRRVPAAIAVRLGGREAPEVELIPASALEQQVAAAQPPARPMGLQRVKSMAVEPFGLRASGKLTSEDTHGLLASVQDATQKPADESRPIRVSGGVMSGNLLSRTDPVYPAEAKAAHVSGAVVLRAVISKEGAIENLTVVSGPEMLQAAALDAVKSWTYKPYLLNGQPTEVDTNITVNFMFGGDAGVGPAEAGAITGVVMDSHGAVLHDVRMTATNSATDAQVSRLTDDAGRYTFAPLPVGVYSVEAAIAGFQRLRQTGVIVHAVQTVGLDIQLKVGSPSYAVNVTGSKAVVVDRQQEDERVTVVPAVVKVEGRASSPAPSGPVKVSSGVLRGGLISQVDPVYPAEAKAAGVQGSVVLKAVIGKDGTVQKLLAMSGPNELQASAIDAVRQWRYKPYLLDGEATEVETTITVNYSVGGDGTNGGAAAAPDQRAGMNRIGGGVSAPVVISSANPEFTGEARRAKVGGNVLVRLVVDEHGTPTKVRVLRGLGVGRDGTMDPKIKPEIAEGLNQKAIEAVSKYRFKPAMRDGSPVAVELNVEVNFQVF